MPFLGTTPIPAAGGNMFAANNASVSDIGRVSQLTQQHDYGLLSTIAGDAAFGISDLVDTVSSSIPIVSKGLGIQRGDFNQAALQALDSPGLTQFYNDNRGGIEAASGVLGTIGAELVARKFTAPAGLLMGALKTLPYARRIASLDADYTAAMGAVRLADKELATRGAMGAESYIGRVGLEGGEAESILGPLSATRNQLVRKANLLGIAKGVSHAAMTEGVMAATLNQNGFLYDDDMAHNIMWMGLGLGIGGAFEKVATGYAIRKYVNSDEIRRGFANALDPDQSEAARILWKDKAPAGLSADDLSQMKDIGYLGGKHTDLTTNLLTGALTREKTPLGTSEMAQGLQSSRSQLATQDWQLANETIQKVTTKGITTNGFTRFYDGSKGYWNHLQQAMKLDPGAVMGAEMIGGVPTESSVLGIHNAHINRLDTLITDLQEKARIAREDLDPKFDFDANDAAIRRFNYEKNLTPTFLIDGEAATLTDARVYDGWEEPTITAERADDETNLWQSFAKDGKAHNVGVDSNLNIFLPRGKTVQNADHYDILRLYRAGQRALQRLKTIPNLEINLPKDANFFQLDMAEQLMRDSDNSIQVNFPNAMTREQAQVESFAQKAEFLRSEGRKLQIKQLAEAKKGSDFDPALEASKLRVRLNLPRLTTYERGVLGESEHPVEQLLRGAAEYGPDKIRQMGLSDLMKGASDIKRIGDLAPTAASDFKDLQGSSFRFMLDDSGRPTKPIIMYKRSLTPQDWTPDNLADRLATQNIYTVQKLMEPAQVGKQQVPTVGNKLAASIMQMPEYDVASRTHELIDPQIQGSLIGTQNQSPFGAVAKALKSRDWFSRDNPILLAAGKLQEAVQRILRSSFEAEAKPLQQIAGVLNSPRNTATKTLLNQFIAYRPGWDLAIDNRKPIEASLKQVPMPGGKTGYQFVLANTEKNQKRWQTMFGEAMPQDAIMPNPLKREVTLDDRGLEFMKAFNQMTESLRTNKNQLLRAKGLREIQRLDFYVPPGNLDGKFIGFTLDAENNVVPNMTVIATTQQQFTREQDKILKTIAEQGKTGYRFMTRDQIKQFADIWDRAQMDMVDPGITAIQPGKRQTGGLTGLSIDPQGVEGILSTLRSQYFEHGNDVLQTMMKDQINSAKSRANVASDVTRNRANNFRDQQFRSIHDYYLEALTGKSPLNSPGSLVGRFYNTIEGTIDNFLSYGAPTASKVWHATNAYIDRLKPFNDSTQARRDFDSLTRVLGDHMPFESAHAYAESQGAGQMPPRLKDLMGGINRFSAAVMLRVFEPAMAVMNLAGMVNAMPSVIRHVAMRDGETAADYAARIGHVATILPAAGSNGKSIGVLDMAKLMTRGYRRAWSKSSEADFDYMRSMGYLTQEVAEFHKQFGAIETKSDLMRFLTGDPDKATAAGVKGKFYSKGLVGWTSVLTDKSEDFSRSWGHMVGLELADLHGIEGVEARNGFAHDLANKMIANYNPQNRPEVFQGAIGAPLGLFQSFILNYYQRIFRYIETKDYHSLATQYAMQAGLFGVTTVPGWAEASKFFFKHSQGDVDPNDSIRATFGQTTGDLIAAGTLSNIPKLFGLDGVDLYSRGDTAVRLPGFNLPPGFTIAKKVMSGLSQGIQAFGTSNPNLTGTQLAEIASNTIPNRPIAGLIEQVFAGGNDVDQTGQIASDTKSMAESVYRVMGVRSIRQSRALEAFYAQKQAMDLKASQDDLLRLATRATIRSGDMSGLPKIFQTYVNNGGDPRHFRRWLKSNYEAATETRSVRALQDSLKGKDWNNAARLLDAGVSIDSDEQTTPYSESLDSPSNFDHVNEDMPDYGTNNTMSLGQ